MTNVMLMMMMMMMMMMWLLQLLKTLPVLQSQVDALLEFDVSKAQTPLGPVSQ